MWLVTTDGFYSAVEHRDDHDCLLVRARVRDDLERAFPGIPIEATPTADYPYRITVGKGAFAAYAAKAAACIDYDNFKSRIVDDHRHHVYLSVWSALRRLSSPLKRGWMPTLWDDLREPSYPDMVSGVAESVAPWMTDPADPDDDDLFTVDQFTEPISRGPRCTCADMCDSFDWTPCPVHPDDPDQ